MRGTLGNILTSILENSNFGKQLGARDMTICVSHDGFHILNGEYIGYVMSHWVYGGICGYMKVRYVELFGGSCRCMGIYAGK